MIAIDPHRCTTRKDNCDLAQYKRLLSTDTPRFDHNSFLSFPSLFISTHTANAETLDRFTPVPKQAEYKTDQFLGATVFSRDGILLVRHQLVDRLLCIHTSHPPLPPSLPPSTGLCTNLGFIWCIQLFYILQGQFPSTARCPAAGPLLLYQQRTE